MYHHLRFRMGIPDSDDTGVPTNEKMSAILLPVRDQTSASLHTQYLVESTERADHLYGAGADIWIVVSVQSNDTIG